MNIKYRFYFFVAVLMSLSLKGFSQPFAKTYWNQHLQINTFRLPLPPVDYEPKYIDLNNDKKIDAIKSITVDSIPVLWLDDDGDMQKGDIEGDLDNDCLLLDRNKDGVYDLVVKYADTDDDGKADLQLIAEYPLNGKKGWPNGHYMIVLDTDHDGVFNYIDWNTMQLKCWEKYGLSDFFTDYSGKTAFIKIHTSTDMMQDIRYNWENPFLFYDPDNDGLSEMAIRVVDTPELNAQAESKGFENKQVKGFDDWISIALDLDNDNAPGNDFDFDCTIGYRKGKMDYSDQVHILKNMRGLPEADKFFIDPRIRHLKELVYPDHEHIWDLIFNRGEWKQAYFVYDEDDDCSRWERVEFYDPADPFKIGTKNGGIDGNSQADWAGDRGEWDLDYSGNGQLYIGKFDGRIHLYGAEWGCWRLDQLATVYQGYDRSWQNLMPKKYATVKYSDTNNNGFLDCIEYDMDGDSIFETKVLFSELGIDDRCNVINISKYRYADFTALFAEVSEQMWNNALKACDIAKKYHINNLWYSKFENPLSSREKYNDGYWLQYYIFKDLEYKFSREKNKRLLNDLYIAYYSSNWTLM